MLPITVLAPASAGAASSGMGRLARLSLWFVDSAPFLAVPAPALWEPVEPRRQMAMSSAPPRR